MKTKKINRFITEAIGELSPESRPFIANFTNELEEEQKTKKHSKKNQFFGL
ncbi:hypothetical protein [Psychroflexus maritimus]|uniref:Uncharacterized protein n=1 Tax=Psychroflexus maritimus TaxID=2714865 RepID=A0A967ADU0_9FLAO|nr:hypothetical protein [Psychroflexus maritimus]NGZ90474.1 hypothetical protein [Psychroflexus maritimus]